MELIYGEIGAHILRDNGVYTIHVLACQQVQTAVADTNAVVIGLYGENSMIQKYIASDEVPDDGYVVKVMDDPDAPERKLALITAKTPCALFYGAVVVSRWVRR